MAKDEEEELILSAGEDVPELGPKWGASFASCPPTPGLRISMQEVVVIACNTLNYLAQHGLPFPLVNYYMRSLVPVVKSEEEGVLSVKFVRFLISSASQENVLSLWRGFFSYFIVAHTLTLVDDGSAAAANSLCRNPAFRFILKVAFQSVAVALASPLYSSMIVDNVLTAAYTECRSSFFFLRLAMDRVLWGTSSLGPSDLFIRPKFAPLSSVAVGLAVHSVGQQVLSSLVQYAYWCFGRLRRLAFGQPTPPPLQTLNYPYSKIHAENFSHVAVLPVMAAIVKLSVQGYELAIDTVSATSSAIISTGSAPTFYRGLIDCIVSIYEDYGFSGYFRGLLPFMIVLLLRYAIDWLFYRIAHLYKSGA